VIIIDDYHSTKRSKNDGGPDDGEAPVIVSLVEAAMQMFSAAIDALPDTSDPEFSGRANVILSGLRKLQTALTKAATPVARHRQSSCRSAVFAPDTTI